LHFLFAWRYFKAKKSTNAINVIAWISVIAIVIGTMALMLVLSVFNGFEGLVKSLYSSFYTDLKLFPASGKTMTLTAEQLQQLRGLKGIKNYSLVVEEKGVLQNGEDQSIIYLKGVDENYRYITGVASHIVRKGVYDLGNEEIPRLVLGAGIESSLGIQADQNIFILKIYLPRKSRTIQVDEFNDISNDSIRTSGAFIIQQDFDSKYAITNIDFARRALRLDSNEYSGVEIKLQDSSAATSMQKNIQQLMGNNYVVKTRYQQNQGLYSIMNLERWVIYCVLCLILVVAAFNMIGALTMLVLEKQKDIAVLHALGGTRRFIQGIFLSEGILLALIGMIVGMILSVVVVLLQIKFHLIALQGGSFLIDYYPVELRLTDFFMVGATVFLIALIASWFPSRKAAKQDFSLRSE
jgi:lipoprotein-releasing system permease protein